MRIGVIGAGYVGLVTGVCLAEMGNHVTLADINHDKIAALQNGQVPIFEPGLDELLHRNVSGGRLFFTTAVAAAASDQEAVFLAVGTPMGDAGAADLRYIYAAAATVAAALTRPAVIVIKSTVPAGTNAALTEKIAPLASVKFAVVSNPEFLKEGAAVADFMKPDRVVIGSREKWAEEVMRQLYAPFLRNDHPLMTMDPESAEMVKYASNAMLACRISFVNEIARLCERLGADIEAVRRGVAADARIGGAFLFAGLGYGGSCFPKDVRALMHLAGDAGVDAPLCAAIDAVNVEQRLALLPFIDRHFPRDLTGKKFAVWGLAFKPQTDDVREAPALYLIKELLARGATVAAYDPQARDTARRELSADGVNGGVDLVTDAYAALTDADALIICTEWNEFRSPDFALIKQTLKQPLIFDGRNLYAPAVAAANGFTYYSVGRRAVGVEQLRNTN
ncbi:UDP-glucose 6-dehydrogenase [Planctomycetales bacterium]|nr:UDP-glucose 6-dehydrogenase [Planctomycetales bacterium]GHS99431.1 UDP-glucose 6-dehydrogenase [Planctomycetales bacterium]GHT06197.1 UDP-glucose 6-dehydrogenase [Planctomycetales bacterium]